MPRIVVEIRVGDTGDDNNCGFCILKVDGYCPLFETSLGWDEPRREYKRCTKCLRAGPLVSTED